ncbi:MAG: tetratricopeptide repeat protein [Pseudomonadota bacterium]|nr:tetratricopeptide repeat protein [Pseudomonadota bacterium]
MSQHTIPNDPFTQLLQRIRQQIAQGQLQEAAQALNAAQAQRPRDARIALLGMRLAEQGGQLDGAVQAARRAVALEPQWPVALIELARLLVNQGAYAEAMQHARQAVAQAAQDMQVLRMALGVAGKAVEREQAVAWARQALAIDPDDVMVRLVLAQQLLDLQDFGPSRQAYEDVLAREPGRYEAQLGLVSLLHQAGQASDARRLADELLARHPDDEQVRYWHGMAHGQAPQLPPTMVAEMFDRQAASFDAHLVRDLQYRVPQLAADRLLALYPDRVFNLLDLGCGTGLLGMCLGPIRGHMIGVDLSEKMIDQAIRHRVYSRFHIVNLLDALRDTPSAHYEAIACLDTLIYVGDLAPVIPDALRILKPSGHFIFSCETAAEDEADWVLRPSNRFAHKASHVQRLCREAGFDDVRIEQLPSLRLEAGQPVPGFLVIARKPA